MLYENPGELDEGRTGSVFLHYVPMSLVLIFILYLLIQRYLFHA